VHARGIADPIDRSGAEGEDLGTGPHAEEFKRADVWSVEIEIVPRRVGEHNRYPADRRRRQPPCAAQLIGPPAS
jgi:hypothetical protein